MNKFIVTFLLVFCAIAYANKYTNTKCTKDENGQEFCQKEEEDDDEEPCLYEDPKDGLYQWDPVKVGFLDI